MADHFATIEWRLTDGDFLKGRYSREHTWSFDGGMQMDASPAPAVVPPPMSNPAHVDPEEAYVASLASCHMLTFLFVAQKAGFALSRYRDEARGIMGRTEKGIPWVERVVLCPEIEWTGDAPDAGRLQELHHAAHEQCFIANSVKTEVVVGPAQKSSQ